MIHSAFSCLVRYRQLEQLESIQGQCMKKIHIFKIAQGAQNQPTNNNSPLPTTLSQFIAQDDMIIVPQKKKMANSVRKRIGEKPLVHKHNDDDDEISELKFVEPMCTRNSVDQPSAMCPSIDM